MENLLPVIELQPFLSSHDSEAALFECRKVAEALKQYGAALVRDPRVSEQDNDTFLDLMEKYFEQPLENLMPDVRKDLGYQVGATPEGIEEPKCKQDERCQEFIAQLSSDNKPIPFAGADPKWRFFWHYGKQPTETRFKTLNPPPVLPKAFPEWESVMNTWGGRIHSAVWTISQMLAIGLDLPENTFTERAEYGPHLLAPTGTDVGKYNKEGTVYAGFHYDLNFITIHGKSRFPGLHIWTREGKKMEVRVPDGCLIIQAGKQLEWLTGGTIEAGYHEVVCTERTLEALKKAEAAERSKWRISSTLFMHIASDVMLEPLGSFKSLKTQEAYPSMYTGDMVAMELSTIKLLDQEE